MLGQPKVFLPGMPAHVLLRSNGRKACFYNPGDFGFYLACLRKACCQNGCLVHAYVLMANHIHLLVTPETERSLPRVIHDVSRRYRQWLGARRGCKGVLWESRYWCSLVDSADYMLACQLYIEMNPVRSGLVEHPADFQWSSYGAHAGQQRISWLSPHRCYLNLGKTGAARGEAYSKLCPEVANDSAWMTRRILQGLPIGSDAFCRRLDLMLSVSANQG